jgi:hypothetical protein
LIATIRDQPVHLCEVIRAGFGRGQLEQCDARQVLQLHFRRCDTGHDERTEHRQRSPVTITGPARDFGAFVAGAGQREIEQGLCATLVRLVRRLVNELRHCAAGHGLLEACFRRVDRIIVQRRHRAADIDQLALASTRIATEEQIWAPTRHRPEVGAADHAKEQDRTATVTEPPICLYLLLDILGHACIAWRSWSRHRRVSKPKGVTGAQTGFVPCKVYQQFVAAVGDRLAVVAARIRLRVLR